MKIPLPLSRFVQGWALPNGLDGRTVGWRANVDRGNKQRVTVVGKSWKDCWIQLKDGV